MSVTQYAGLRYSFINIDDYSVEGELSNTHFSSQSMDVLSFSVGVTFAKEFTGDAWMFKPSLDLTVTDNFGDDETDGTVHGASERGGLRINVSSEEVDNFTYGATLGVP